MLHDRDPNASGRTSRGSSMSAVSRAPSRPPPGAPKPDLGPSALPGVMSMLRTSTEMGIVAGATGHGPGMGNMPRPPQRFGASSRLSTASSLSNHSSRASRRPRDGHPHASVAHYGSMRDQSAPQYMPDTLSPTTVSIPASSPRTTHRDRMRQGHRSRSLTNPMHASYALSSNRSLGNLRPVPEQRPRSPYYNQASLRRPYHRSASPGSGEYHGNYSGSYSNSYFRGYNPQGSQGRYYDPAHMDRNYGQPYHPGPATARYGQPYSQGQMRRRVPSDGSLNRQERTHGRPRRSGRSPSPAYYTGPGSDAPPMPRIPPQFMAAEQHRMLNPSMRGSASSRSTNLRADSDTPSSDMASPPTPHEGVSIEMFMSPNGSRVPVYTKADHARNKVPRGPQYYDYSEPFENEQFRRIEDDQLQVGTKNKIKAIMRNPKPLVVSASQRSRSIRSQRSVPAVQSSDSGTVEVPASPVQQRITREMILKATESTPTSGTLGTVATTSAKSENIPPLRHSSVAAHHAANDQIFISAPSASRLNENLDSQLSSLSRARSSVPESLTPKSALQGSLPTTARTGHGTESSCEADSDSELLASPYRSTKDGFSDVLTGYQQIETKHSNDAVLEPRATPREARISNEQADKESSHAQKSSGVQSFKSATDVLSEREPSVKDSDAPSFTTCENNGSPDRAASMPPPNLLSSSLASFENLEKRPASEMALAFSPLVLRKPLLGASQENSMMFSKDATTSKPAIQQSSSSVLSMSQQPPPVPPRGSSSSREAQNSHSVSSFLMRQWPARFARGMKRPKEDSTSDVALSKVFVREPTQRDAGPKLPGSYPSLPVDGVIQTPEKVLRKQEVVPERQIATPLLPNDSSAEKEPGSQAAPTSHQRAFNSPSPDIPQPSSVYSPEDSPARSRLRSSQTGVLKFSEHSRPDNQTTTHLDWHGGRSFNSPSVYGDESPVPFSHSREGSTTDLRLSDYRYAGAYADRINHLPQVREESHEDSSLNTSASNLMHSRFRLPATATCGVRVSADDANVVSRSSMGSHQYGSRGSAQAQPRGLPSMDFSEMNLVHKLQEALGLPKEDSDGQPSTKTLGKESAKSAGEPLPLPRELREEYNSVIAEIDGLGLRKSLESVHLTTATESVNAKTSHSPIAYKDEIEGVRVPSIGPLTEKLTKLLSSMRQYSGLGANGVSVKEEVLLEQVLSDIHDLGFGGLVPKRSHARLRPVPGSPSMIVVEDAVYEGLISKEKEGRNAGHQGEGAAELSPSESGPDVEGKQGEGATHNNRHHDSSSSGLGRPSPAVLRPRALTTGHPDLCAAPDHNFPSAQSVKSIVSEPTATNPYPWRSDKNFPWEDSEIPSIDIALPAVDNIKHSPRPGPSHLRNTISDASFDSSFSSANTATGSPFGTASDSNAHARHHRFSNFGRAGDQPHAVGERYPTSALTPPTAIFRDHSSAFDSSDDEDFNSTRKPKLGLIKRFSSARNGTADNKPRGVQAKTSRAQLVDSEPAKQFHDSPVQDLLGNTQALNSRRLTFRNAVGMRTVEYRRIKIFDKLKGLWEKGRSLIRTLSSRKQSDSTSN